MRSYTCCGVCCSAGKAAAQCGQTSSLASTMRSGFGSSARPTPGRLLRGGLSPAGRSDFWPVDGGSEELSGVFGGRSNTASRFSNSAMRASAASNCPTNGSSDRMRSSFSAWLSLLRSIPCVTQSLNRVARDRVNHDLAVRQPPTPRRPGAPSRYQGEQLHRVREGSTTIARRRNTRRIHALRGSCP